MDIFSQVDVLQIFVLGIFAFIAGFIDAVVGGGGLIQLPALLINLPSVSIPTLFGTNKIAALSGTLISAFQYAKRIKFNYSIIFIISLCAGVASFLGAKLVSYINVNVLKPLILVILIIILVYTILKKNFGSIPTKNLSIQKQMIYGSLIGFLVGFYDGFFGPGTGSFLVLGFVVLLGFDFLKASAYAKIVNCFTNIGALFVFISQGNFIFHLAAIMAICNITGSFFGAKMAMKEGNGFIRMIFIIIVSIMIMRYGYELYQNF